jgi:hypothetical protein
MKKILLSLLLLCSATFLAAQCDNATLYPSATYTLALGANTITVAQYAGEYNVTTGYIVGTACNYVSSKITDFITLRRASDNVVIAYGVTPLNIIYAASMGNIEMHVSANAACGTENINRATTITMSIYTPCNNAFQYPAAVTAVFMGSNEIATSQWAGDYNVTTNYTAGANCSFTSNNITDFITLRKASDNAVIAYGVTPVNITYSASMGNIKMHINTNAFCGVENVNRTTTITMSVLNDDNAFRGGNNDGYATQFFGPAEFTDNNAFRGGVNDGFAFQYIAPPEKNDDNAFRGGFNDGFSAKYIAPPEANDDNLFRGGIGRGETQIKFNPTSCNGVPIVIRTWNGSVSTAWENPSNWACGIMPIINSEVVIPNGVPNYPIVNYNTEIKKLTLNSDASIIIMPAVNFKLNAQ